MLNKLKQLYKLEKVFLFCLFGAMIKFPADSLAFWVSLILLIILFERFEDAIRREYGDSLKENIARILSDDNDEDESDESYREGS